MEREKRKREQNGAEEGKGKKVGEVDRREDATVPSEEEVEEFFAILRRMKVAVSYFDRKGKGEGWRTALESATEVMEVEQQEDEEEDEKLVGTKAAQRNGGLDLNAAPEGENSA